jgi:hypothetical protein
MRKLFVIGLLVGLVTASVAMPAHARGQKPVKTTLYLHGNYPVEDGFEVINFVSGGTPMAMNPTEPAAGAPKSMAFYGPGNDQCVGNPFFPSWQGPLAGTITGDLKVIVNTVAAPSKVTARVWVDVPYGSCTSAAAGAEAFVPPVAEQIVDIPPGANEVEIVFKKLKLKVMSSMVVELHATSPAAQGRVMFDSPEFLSRLEFSCTPSSGKACTP